MCALLKPLLTCLTSLSVTLVLSGFTKNIKSHRLFVLIVDNCLITTSQPILCSCTGKPGSPVLSLQVLHQLLFGTGSLNSCENTHIQQDNIVQRHCVDRCGYSALFQKDNNKHIALLCGNIWYLLQKVNVMHERALLRCLLNITML